jgi:hypothetical protein
MSYGPRQAALERLRRAGAETRPAMRARALALAAERAIPLADYRRLLFKRPNVRDVMAFCTKYQVSTDWLLVGDLQGLRRMARWRRSA